MKRFNENIVLFYEMDKLKTFILQDIDADLSSLDIDLINFLYFYKLDSVKELCVLMGCKNNLVSKVIKRLYQKEYIDIEREIKDRRIKIIKLTDKGYTVAKILNERLHQFFIEAFKDFNNSEIELFIKMFNECSIKFKRMKNDKNKRKG